jgi:histone deacetylase 1/2
VYADDLLVTRNNEAYIASIKKELKKGFEMTNMGYIHYYLGIEVTHNPNYVFMSQDKYTRELMNKFGMVDCNPLYSNGAKFEVNSKRRE